MYILSYTIITFITILVTLTHKWLTVTEKIVVGKKAIGALGKVRLEDDFQLSLKGDKVVGNTGSTMAGDESLKTITIDVINLNEVEFATEMESFLI